MKKRRFAVFIMIFALICCVGVSGFAEGEGELPPDAAGTEAAGNMDVTTGGEPTGGEVPGGEPTGGETTGGETGDVPVIPEEPFVPATIPPTVPYITKNPGAEVVQAGEGCLFIAKAENYTSINWYFTKNGQIIYAANAAQQFPGLKVTGDGTEFFSCESVPESLNGWSVGAVFSNAVGQQGTTTCTITVTAPASPSPKVTPSPKPTTAPTPTPRPTVTLPPTAAPVSTPAATATASVSPTPEVEAEKTESEGFPFGLLLIAVLVAALLGGGAVLFILYRSGRLGQDNIPEKSVRISRYDDYDDDDDDDYDNKKSYRGKH